MSSDREIDNLLEDIKKDFKKNTQDYINKGEKINFDCEICKRETVGEYLGNSKLRCTECGNIFDVNFEVV